MKTKLIVVFLVTAFFWLNGCATGPSLQKEPVISEPAEIPVPREIKTHQGQDKLVAPVGVVNKSIYKAENLWDVATDIMATKLIETGYFRVVNWDIMKRDFNTAKLESATLVNAPDSLEKVQTQLSCDYYIGGSITYYDVSRNQVAEFSKKEKNITTTVRVDLWIQDSITGEYMAASSATGRVTQTYTGGLTGGSIGSWSFAEANKALAMAVNKGVVNLLTQYHRRSESEYSSQKSVTEAKKSGPGIAKGDSRVKSFPFKERRQFVRKDDKWAIIIGISDFMDKKITSLEYTDDDAKALYDYLVNPAQGKLLKEQVFYLVDQDATTFNIKFAIDLISKNALPQDKVFIYISSHGSPKSMDIAGVGFFVTYDTLLNSLYATAFDMEELSDAIRNRIRANQVVTFIDTCYSAGTFRGAKFMTIRGAKDLVFEPNPGSVPKDMVQSVMKKDKFAFSDSAIRQFSNTKGRAIVTSSSENEQSYEAAHLGHGYFTYFLIQALKKGGQNITIHQLYRHLIENIPAAVMDDLGLDQHPVLGLAQVKGDMYLFR